MHLDQSFWTASNVFLAISGLLLAALSQILIRRDELAIMKPFAFIYSLGGLFVAAMWMLVTNRKIAYVKIVEDMARNIESELYSAFPENVHTQNVEGKDLVGLGFFSATKLIFHDGDPNRWLARSYPCRKWIASRRSGNVMAVWLPVFFGVIWISLASWFAVML